MLALRLFALLFLLLLPLSYSAPCQAASRSIYLAAVTGENSGGVFQLTVETKPGNGTIYTAITPRTGFATQDSEESAVRYAFSSSGYSRSDCDVLFRINGDFNANTIDGPSAGGAMAVATRAALLGKQIRQDIVMTGTISPEGGVGEVGGVIEKSLAAADAGAKYFLVPKLQVHEALLISSFSSAKDFRAIEVKTEQDAEKILFSGYSQNFSSQFRPESKQIPEGLPQLPIDADMGRFTLVAKKVVDDLGIEVRGAFQQTKENNDTETMRAYFNHEISKYYSLLPKGYPFTAANAAFLLSIDAEYVRIGDAKIDLDGSVKDVSACISQLKSPAKTGENFHWALGADLRRLWAEQKLNQTIKNRAEQSGYSSLRDLLFAYSWCKISGELASQANDIGGEPADESALSELAGEKINEAEQALSSSARLDYDSAWHLDNAYAANKSGNYGAAIYEASYAETMQGISSESVENVSEAAEKLSAGSRSSLWGKIYYGQGMYLYQEALNGKFAPTDAYRLLQYSSDLDRTSGRIDRELLKKKGEIVQRVAVQRAPAAKAPTEMDAMLSIILAPCVAVFGLSVIWRLAKGKKPIKVG